ncbi:MAG: biotin--[acetyl-CoA-carboxylase] ligase [Planctomycetes bacterium]|nr:biotin--[acetyl-CoA-carboxylase] ligase [Planctomycetota bacterium]
MKLLHYLRTHCGQWMQMQALQHNVSLDPQQILTVITRLRNQGYKIETSPVNGFRLEAPPEKLNADLIEFELTTERVGNNILVYETTDSTNDVAWHYAAETGYDGLAVFAEHQRAGRGRLGRQWLAPSGSSVLCSILLQDQSPSHQEPLTLLAGLATAQAIECTCTLPVRIKWPNDVTCLGRKIAGTIVESRQINSKLCYVIGIGINCRQNQEDFDPELQSFATSIQQNLDRQIDRVELARQLLVQFDKDWNTVISTGCQSLHDQWLNRCDDLGRRITLVQNNQRYTGRVIDVNPQAGLMLQLDTGAVKIFPGATASVVID